METTSSNLVDTTTIEAFFTRLDKPRGSHIGGFVKWAKSSDVDALSALEKDNTDALVQAVFQAWQSQVDQAKLQGEGTPDPKEKECVSAIEGYLQENKSELQNAL